MNRAQRYFKGLSGLGANQTYTVKSGDSLSNIAQAFYGDYTLYTFLAQVNKIANPNVIYPGTVLIIPPDPTLQANDSNANDASQMLTSTAAPSPSTTPVVSSPVVTSATTTSSTTSTSSTSSTTVTVLKYVGLSLLIGGVAFGVYKMVEKKKGKK